MSSTIQPSEFSFFVAVATSSSLSAAARHLGVSTPAVSKRLSQIEARVGVTLINRTTRRTSLTPEGEIFYTYSRRILSDIDELDELITRSKESPRGLLRVHATFGFGRMYVAPAISSFAKIYGDVDIRLTLGETAPSLVDDLYDISIQFGDPPDSRLIARRLAANERLICASPKYLAERGTPDSPQDLIRHNCIDIRQGTEAFGVWRFKRKDDADGVSEAIKVKGNLATNDGESAVEWALAGHGIVMRAQWDVDRYLHTGRLVRILPDWQTPSAPVYAVFPQRHQSSSRVKLFVDHLATALQGLR